jgi:hypothetical protein
MVIFGLGKNFSVNVVLMPISSLDIKLSVSGKLFGLWVALVTVLVPASYILATVTQIAPTDTQMLLDPGPRHLCYQFSDVHKDSNTTRTSKSVSQCSQVPGYAECPTWEYSWFNAGQKHEDLMTGGNGSLINVTLINNAEGVSELSEVSLDYLYPGCAIQRWSNSTQYNLLNYDQWILEYDLQIRIQNNACIQNKKRSSPRSWNHTSANFSGCSNAQQFLSTEFVYQWPDPECSNLKNASCTMLNNTMSAIHYYPTDSNNKTGLFEGANMSKIVFQQWPRLNIDVETRVSLDFSSLFRQYTPQICHGIQPAWVYLRLIRIVSSNININSTVEIHNIQATLRKRAKSSGKGLGPEYVLIDSIPTYCHVIDSNLSTNGAISSKRKEFVA